jgi:hypothetical protein
MSPRFGSYDDKSAQRAAASAEIERLCLLPAPDLAAAILPAWASDWLCNSTVPARDAAQWLMAAYPKGPSLDALIPPVGEAIQVLEHSGLLIRTVLSSGGSNVDLTRLGRAALVQGTVRQHLPECPPALPMAWAGQIPALQGVPASVIGLAWTHRAASAVHRYRELTGANVRQAERVVRAVAELPLPAGELAG